MQRVEVIAEIEQRTGLEKPIIESVLKAFLVSVEENLVKGEHITLLGFGRFNTSKRAAKIGQNIKKNTPVKIPSHYVPTFKFSKRIKMKIKKSLCENKPGIKL